jgi:AbrB family looped-hinge helix DNA binding protein
MIKTFYPRISSKGQITIPSAIRDYLGVKEHDQVSISVNEDGAVVVRPLEYTFESIIGSIPDIPNSTPDLDKEILEAMEDFYDERKQVLKPW